MTLRQQTRDRWKCHERIELLNPIYMCASSFMNTVTIIKTLRYEDPVETIPFFKVFKIQNTCRMFAK